MRMSTQELPPAPGRVRTLPRSVRPGTERQEDGAPLLRRRTRPRLAPREDPAATHRTPGRDHHHGLTRPVMDIPSMTGFFLRPTPPFTPAAGFRSAGPARRLRRGARWGEAGLRPPASGSEPWRG